MSNVLAGIGRGQLEVLKERVDAKRKLNMFYANLLKDIPEFNVKQEPTEHFFKLLVELSNDFK